MRLRYVVMGEDEISRHVVDAAIKIHSKLGPGLLESAYEACLSHELRRRRLTINQQVPVPLQYEDTVLDIAYRLDLLIDDKVVVELKCADKLLPIHTAQLISYLRLGGYRLGLLLNFHTLRMIDGIKRVANGL